MIFGLIGEHLGHSFSAEIHARLGKEPYELRELAPEDVAGFLREGDFRGINVTIPYKQAVIPYLGRISETADAIGAVNVAEELSQDNSVAVSMEQIYEKVWDEPAYNPENTVAVHIRRIREKIEIDPKNPRYLKVVWGVGYKVEKH